MPIETPLNIPAFDAIVVGGSYAGQSAALQLARARRRVLVVDAGQRRNRFAASAHGFLGHDGSPPAAIAALGKSQLLAYPTVQWREATASQAAPTAGGFALTLDDGTQVQAQCLVLATGVVDEMPSLPGLAGVAPRWGRSVFHCPYCHGYELNQGRIGVLATSALAYHHAAMLPDWGTVTLFTNGVCPLDAEQTAQLARRGVTIAASPVADIRGVAEVLLEDGSLHAMDGLFTQCRTSPASPLAAQLGCAMEESPMGLFIQADAFRQTTVPGVLACGDTARMAGNVALAVGDGALAGAMAHRLLLGL